MGQKTSFGAMKYTPDTMSYVRLAGANSNTLSLQVMVDFIGALMPHPCPKEARKTLQQLENTIIDGDLIILSKKEIAEISKDTHKVNNPKTATEGLREKFALLKKIQDEATPAPQYYLDKISKAAQKILTVDQQQQTRRTNLEELLVPQD